MKQLNMRVEDDVKQAAVDGARQDGMLLGKWVGKAILERRARQEPLPTPREQMANTKQAEEV